MFYNARWYDGELGRFAQADTIVPGGVQGYDRYAYANNAPTRYTDPSGHKNCEEDGYNCHYGIPDWDPIFGKAVSERDKAAALRAYYHFLSNPEHFASLYVDPQAWFDSDEVAALEIFAEYTKLQTTADQLVLSSYQPESASLLRQAQTRNLTDPGSVTIAGGLLLYRAVSNAEFKNLMVTGKFSEGPNSMQGKWFAESGANARQWGEWFYGSSSEYHVVSVELDADLVNSMMRVSKLDGIGPARYAEDLQALNGGVISIHEVPK